MIASWQESYDNPRQCVKKAKTSLCRQNLYSQGYGLSSSLVQMWELDYKEGWVPKKWCFRTAGLEMTLESPLESKEIKPVNTKGNQPWILFGRTDAEAETPVLCKQLTHWKRPWLWERLKAEGEEGDRGWDGWMASLIQWSWTWANSWRWWRTGKPGELQSMVSWRVGHNLATEQKQLMDMWGVFLSVPCLFVCLSVCLFVLLRDVGP